MNGFNPDGLVLSENYAQTMRDATLPSIEARRTNLTLSGDGGRSLFVSRFDADTPRATVLIVHGFTENVEKFSEIIHALLRNHFSVVAWDQRGHGRSWRPEGLADISLTHVDAFDKYVRDMGIVYEQVVAAMPKPHRALCHSMGGAVTGLFLESRPGLFDRAAMCSPMIAPNLGALPKPAARLLCMAEKALGRGKRRIIGSRPYAEAEAFEASCATSRERFGWYEALRLAIPAFQNNGPTYGWTLESIDVTDRLLAPGAPERIDARVRLYSAGLDNTVLSGPQKAFISRVKLGSYAVVQGAKHEIYRSEDRVLFPWWHDVLNFLKEET